MFNHPLALELAYTAVEEAIRLGASFADARFELRQHEDVGTRNGALVLARLQLERGLGLRVLVRGAWGFAAIGEPNRHDVAVVARRAVDQARAAAVLRDRPAALVEAAPQRALYRTPLKRDPLAVPLEDKVALLLALDERLRRREQVVLAELRFSAHRQRKVYVSSEGSELDQELIHTGIQGMATASDGRELARRSFPHGARGLLSGRGWESLQEQDLLAQAERAGEEAVALLTAEPCPSRVTEVVLGGAQVAAQLEATLGPLLSLDRALGLDAEDGGSSFLVPESLGRLELGSAQVTVIADAREPGGAGTYGFDDEGVEGQRLELISGGRFTGYLASRETAERVGLDRASGAMRAPSWAFAPTLRPNNLSLLAGVAGTADDLLAGVKDGVWIDGGRVVGVDAHAGSFLAAGEIAYEIKDGKKGRLLRSPAYQGHTVDFWRSCAAFAGPAAWALYGSAQHGERRPTAFVHSAMGAAPALFSRVEVGAQAGHPLALAADASPELEHPQLASVPPSEVARAPARGAKKAKKKTKKRDTR